MDLDSDEEKNFSILGRPENMKELFPFKDQEEDNPFSEDQNWQLEKLFSGGIQYEEF